MVLSVSWFADRAAAGRFLAHKLEPFGRSNGIRADGAVLGISRGGVVVADEVARVLGLPLDIISIRKLVHPNAPELALCAVDENGTRVCDERRSASMDPSWLAGATEEAAALAARRSALYHRHAEPVALTAKSVIIIDDGIATGLTMRVAVERMRRLGVHHIIVGVPVASEDGVHQLSGIDAIIVLVTPVAFSGAVGGHYASFEEVTDEDVVRILVAARSRLAR